MAKSHRVLVKCYLAERGTKEARQYGPGVLIDYDGPPAAYLEPVDSDARLLWKELFPHAPRNLPIGL